MLVLFSSSHLSYVAERREDTTQPTLAEMTARAIELLSAAEDGYLLLIEGGRIDHGHHIGKPAYALLETQAFARAGEIAAYPHYLPIPQFKAEVYCFSEV